MPRPRPFTIVHGTSLRVQNLWLRVTCGRHHGDGEGAPRESQGEDLARALAALRRVAPWLRRRVADLVRRPAATSDQAVTAIAAVMAEVAARTPGERSLHMAVDLALHDLLGKILAMPVWRMLGVPAGRTAPVSYTIPLDDLDGIRQRVAESRGHGVLKVKLGRAGDLEALEEVRRLAPRATLRVDANGGWTPTEAKGKLKRLAALGVELCEQPLAPRCDRLMPGLRRGCDIPLVADESCRDADDVERLAKLGAVDGVNLKLTKCGGIAAARRAIDAARARGLRIMLGCMGESSLALAGAGQLAPLADWLDLDGNLLLTDAYRGFDLGPGARPLLTTRPGLGVARRARAVVARAAG